MDGQERERKRDSRGEKQRVRDRVSRRERDRRGEKQRSRERQRDSICM